MGFNGHCSNYNNPQESITISSLLNHRMSKISLTPKKGHTTHQGFRIQKSISSQPIMPLTQACFRIKRPSHIVFEPITSFNKHCGGSSFSFGTNNEVLPLLVTTSLNCTWNHGSLIATPWWTHPCPPTPVTSPVVTTSTSRLHKTITSPTLNYTSMPIKNPHSIYHEQPIQENEISFCYNIVSNRAFVFFSYELQKLKSMLVLTYMMPCLLSYIPHPCTNIRTQLTAHTSFRCQHNYHLFLHFLPHQTHQ